MAPKGRNGVAAKVWDIAEPIAKELGLKLWDIRFLKEGAEWYLRVFIDKDGGVSIDDCVDMSHALDKPLDEYDPIDRSYCLEVSSPGIERELSIDEHFEASLGKSIKVKLIRPVDNQREFIGTLESFDGSDFVLRLDDEKAMVINKKETANIKLNDFGG
ncbi:MAG: ribosome maturation factor RimP [Clostridia bacterium]|nr:ribosome maturation factor RimP [Clostridia bacterium]